MNRLKFMSALMLVLVSGALLSAALVVPASADFSMESWVQVGDTITVASKRGASTSAEDGKILRENAALSLTAEITEVGERWFRFNVKSWTIKVDGASFSVSSGEGGLRIARRGAPTGIKGYVQNGEFKFGGRAFLRDGKVVVVLGGQLAVGSDLYTLRLLADASKNQISFTGRDPTTQLLF